jgi:hypothetical protein
MRDTLYCYYFSYYSSAYNNGTKRIIGEGKIDQTLCGGVGAGRQYSMTGDDRARGTASRGLARQSALLEAPACKVDDPLMQEGCYVAIC